MSVCEYTWLSFSCIYGLVIQYSRSDVNHLYHYQNETYIIPSLSSFHIESSVWTQCRDCVQFPMLILWGLWAV